MQVEEERLFDLFVRNSYLVGFCMQSRKLNWYSWHERELISHYTHYSNRTPIIKKLIKYLQKTQQCMKVLVLIKLQYLKRKNQEIFIDSRIPRIEVFKSRASSTCSVRPTTETRRPWAAERVRPSWLAILMVSFVYQTRYTTCFRLTVIDYLMKSCALRSSKKVQESSRR